MKTLVPQYCGGCGAKTFKVLFVHNKRTRSLVEVEIRCTGCSGKNRVRLQSPALSATFEGGGLAPNVR